MKYALLIAIIAPMMVLSANASDKPQVLSEVNGMTTCTKVTSFDKRLSQDMPCSYKAVMGSSNIYAIRHIDFQLPNGDKIKTTDNIRFAQKANGDLVYKDSKITLNTAQAVIINISPKTFKEILSSRMDELRAMDNPDYSKILHCFKPIDSETAFCVPYDFLLKANK